MARKRPVTVDEILSLIQALPDQDQRRLQYRLAAPLLDQQRASYEAQAKREELLAEEAVRLAQEVLAEWRGSIDEKDRLEERVGQLTAQVGELHERHRTSRRLPDAAVTQEAERIADLRRQGKSWRQITNELRINLNTARSRLHRLKKRNADQADER